MQAVVEEQRGLLGCAADGSKDDGMLHPAALSFEDAQKMDVFDQVRPPTHTHTPHALSLSLSPLSLTHTFYRKCAL